MSVTLKDIARVAGYSVNTVSLALNDSSRISGKTKERIRAVAREMDYIPNNLARSLVLGKTGTIGLILRNISSTTLVSEARRIERYLGQLGYTLSIVTSQNDPEIEAKAINIMLSNKVDGILLNTSFGDNISRMEQLRESGYPVVLISGFPKEHAKLDAIYPNLEGGAYLATKHLLELGHSSVSFIFQGSFPERVIHNNPKVTGYRKALDEAGIAFSMDLVLGLDFDYLLKFPVSEAKRLREHIKDHTAFFMSEDETAIPVMKAMMEMGVRIPEQIAVSSLDNIRYAESAVVALTSVGFDIGSISRQAVDMLVEIIEGRRCPGVFANIPVQPKLYIRESCGAKKQAKFSGAAAGGEG